VVSLTSAAVIAAVALLSPLIVRLARLPVPEIVLQLVAGALLLVALPPQRPALVALRGGQTVHSEPLQDPPYPGGADRHVVVAGQIHRNLGRAEVVVLPQPEDLLDHLGLGYPW